MNNFKCIVFSYDEIRCLFKFLEFYNDDKPIVLSFSEWHQFKNVFRHLRDIAEKELINE